MSNKIESNDVDIRKLFQEYYIVPDYQRDYVWGENTTERPVDEVELFLSDIHSEFEEHTPDTPTEYFIGTIITCGNRSGSLDVIDGQQRLTTIYLTVCALRDAIANAKDDTAELKSLISQVSTDSFGKKLKRNRLELQYPDSGDVLETIVLNETINEENLTTRSAKNLFNSYRTISNFLRTKFGENKSDLKRFEGYFLSSVKLIRVETPNLRKALMIFATINDRGVGLDAMDLLKNLMFINANPTQFANLKTDWKKLTDTIYQANEKPLRFLRYFILADYSGDSRVREDDAYAWFQNNADEIGYDSDPRGLVSSLNNAAAAYKNFRSGKNKYGDDEAALTRIQRLGGSSVRQPYILLLAGRHLKKADFSNLAQLTEDLFFMWLITGTQSKVTEPAIVKLARQLKNISSGDDAKISAFLKHVKQDVIKPKSKEFTRAMMNMHQWDMPKYRMKYVLAKITQFIEQQAFNVKASNVNLDTFLDSSLEIEHIHPMEPTKKAIEEFGDSDEDYFFRQALGNLTLLDKSRNIIARNHPFSEKVKIYQEANFMLTQYIHSSPKVGKSDRISKTFDQHLKAFSKWNSDSVLARQKMLTHLAHETWSIPLEYTELPDWDLLED